MERQIWILGHGPVVIHHQFQLDVPRGKGRFKINDIVLSDNVFSATRLLYTICDIHYYQYTKYMNQTMGNMMVMYLQRIYHGSLIYPCHGTYIIRARYKPHLKDIHAQMIIRLIIENICIRRVRCVCKYDIIKHKFVVNIDYM